MVQNYYITDMAFTLVGYRKKEKKEKKNIRIKAATTCANQARYPDTVLSKKLLRLGGVDIAACRSRCLQG